MNAVNDPYYFTMYVRPYRKDTPQESSLKKSKGFNKKNVFVFSTMKKDIVERIYTIRNRMKPISISIRTKAAMGMR